MTPKSWPDNPYYRLIDCVIHNHLEEARILIPQCDCTQESSYLLQLASCHGHEKMFDLLYPFSNPHAALDSLISDNNKDIARGEDPSLYVFGETLLRERVAMEQLHENLTTATATNESRAPYQGSRKI